MEVDFASRLLRVRALLSAPGPRLAAKSLFLILQAPRPLDRRLCQIDFTSDCWFFALERFDIANPEPKATIESGKAAVGNALWRMLFGLRVLNYSTSMSEFRQTPGPRRVSG